MLMKIASALNLLPSTNNHLQNGKIWWLMPSFLFAIRVLRSFETSENCLSNSNILRKI